MFPMLCGDARYRFFESFFLKFAIPGNCLPDTNPLDKLSSPSPSPLRGRDGWVGVVYFPSLTVVKKGLGFS